MLNFAWDEALKVLIFSSASVLYLFFIAKLLGKKQIAQLSFIDYILGISIGSIAAEMATDISNTPVYYYLIGMTIFFLFDVIVSFIERKSPSLKGFFRGKPAVLIYDGKINFNSLQSTKLTVNDLIELCREKGYFDIDDVAFAIFETSGKLSVMPKGNLKPTVAEDFSNIKVVQSSLPTYLVCDGIISYSSLREIGKDENWLFKKMKIKNKKDLKQVVLAVYDEQQNNITVHQKNN